MRWVTEKQRRQMELGKHLEAKAIALFLRRFSIRAAKEGK